MSKPTEDPATEPLAPERLAEIQARADAATPGPWGYYDGGDYADIASEYQPTGPGSYAFAQSIARIEAGEYEAEDADEAAARMRADAEFIAHAPQDISGLLDEIGWLAAELADRTAELITSAGVAEQAWERNTALIKENARLRAELNAKADAR